MTTRETDTLHVPVATHDGNEAATDRHWALVYDSLKRIAHRELSRVHGGTLATTDLVHEAYLKCANLTRDEWKDQAHFQAIVCRAMRQVLIDRARRGGVKRFGQRWSLPLDAALVMAEQRSDELLALDEALERLARYDLRLARLVEYRFFGGFTLKETAGFLSISLRSAERDWQRARIFLYAILHSKAGRER